MRRRTLFINDSIWQRLVELAEKSGASVSELIRRAILEFLRREEGE